MTDRLGRRASWSTALVAAPGTAALFGLATSWAISTSPQQAQPVAAQPAPVLSAQSDHRIGALQRSISANQRTLATLQRQLAELRRQLAAPTRPAGAAGQAGSAGSTGSGPIAGSSQPVAAGPVRVGNGSAGSPAPVAAPPVTQPPVAAPSAAPPPPPAPSSAPAPPVQTSTGASGKKP